MKHIAVIVFAALLIVSCGPSASTPASPPTATPRPNELWVQADGGGDYASIQEAIDALAPSGTLHLGSGLYELSQTLEIAKDIAIIGEGQVTISSAASPYVVLFEGNHTSRVSAVSFVYSGEGSGSVISVTGGLVVFEDIDVQGATGSGNPDDQPGGLHFTASSQGIVKQSSFEDNSIGILVDSGASVVMREITAQHNDVGVMFTDDAEGQLEDSNLGNSYGVWITGNASPRIEGNVFSQALECGVNVQQSGSGDVTENTFDGAGQAGICVGAEVGPEFHYYDNEFTALTAIPEYDLRMTAPLQQAEVLFSDEMAIGVESWGWAPTNDAHLREDFWEINAVEEADDVVPGQLGLTVDFSMGDNRAFMFDFSASGNSWIEATLVGGDGPGTDHRMLELDLQGVIITSGILKGSSLLQGPNWIYEETIGQLPAVGLETWYTALLALDDAGEYRIYISPRAGGDGLVNESVILDESFLGREWGLGFGVYQGSARIDNLYLLSFEGYR